MVNWIAAPTVFDVRHVLMEVYGDTDTGRTTFALSAPGPIAFIGFGEKVRGIVEPFQRAGKNIYMVECGGDFRGGRDAIRSAATVAEAAMFEAMYDAFNSQWARTVIVDTATEAWLLSRYAEFGGAKPDGGRQERNWEGVNNRWRQMLVAARRSNRNVIFVDMTSEEWVNKTKTGRTVRDTVFGPLPTKCDVYLRTYGAAKPEGGKNFAIQIEKAWMNSAVANGQVLHNELISFANVMSLVTGTDPREWS